jgi:hypothetical protein
VEKEEIKGTNNNKKTKQEKREMNEERKQQKNAEGTGTTTKCRTTEQLKKGKSE